MIEDEHMADELRAFYEEKPVVRPDSDRMADTVLAEIHAEPQDRTAHRWLPSLR